MAIETLPEPSIPVTTPFRPSLGFLTSTPIIAVASVFLLLIILMAIFAPLLAPHDPLLLTPAQRLKTSERAIPARHRRLRPRRALAHHLRGANLAADRGWDRPCSRSASGW